MPKRATLIALAVWSALVLAFYVWTVVSNCSESGQADGNDCGAAIGLGVVMAVMIWLAGAIVVALVAGAVALIRRLAR
jgi:hypothetical protein